MHERFTETLFARATLRARFALAALMLLLLAASAAAQSSREQPRSFSQDTKAQADVQRKVLPKVDTDRLLEEDREREKDRNRPGPQRFAAAVNVNFTLDNSGTWETLPDGRLWRLRIHSPEAKSHNLGIKRFDMPEGARLWVYDPGRVRFEGPYTARNRSQSGSLWTPVVAGDEIVVEVFVPTGVAQPVVEIHRVNQGYRGSGKPGDKAGILGNSEGACNNDVICPQGDPWRDQMRAVAVYVISWNGGIGSPNGGSGTCTGTLLNNTRGDGTPYFLSANHCLANNADPASVVVYWNFESPTCGTHDPGPLSDNQTGSVLRANFAASDFALFELSQVPEPGFNVFYAGWDASETAHAAAVGIHQPRGDVKAITFANSETRRASYDVNCNCQDPGTLDPNGNHWRADWDSGVTEKGSSGSCLFETGHGRCIGQLHGGPSSCTQADGLQHDYYGMLSASWNGGGTSDTRLRDWLDPDSTGVLTNDGDPHITTAGGTHYDFQGAGEYVAFRNASSVEIQTRQSPVSTASAPLLDPYDGVAACVSVNTAVAARVGTRRVTYEPNLSGVPDPSGLQLRVDGALVTLGALGLDLGGGGRILKTSVAGGLEFDFPDGTVMFVTPNWWQAQSKWYMNVEVLPPPVADGMGTGAVIKAATTGGSTGSSARGLMGAIPPGSWLPALPDGTSMGPMPAAVHDRYVDLYQKFGEAWRVTNATTLFDYAPGTSTTTFTLKTWPAENGPCTIAGAPTAQPTDQATAEQACKDVTGKNQHRDCVFDVMVTGETGFADAYRGSQAVVEHGPQGGDGATPPTNPVNPGTPGLSNFAVFFDLGAAFPHASFSTFFDPGPSFNAGLEYIFNPHFSAEAVFGFHRFPGAFGDLNLYQFSGDAKAYLNAPPNQLRPFVRGGVGAYKFGSGSTRFGGHIGAGLLYELTPHFGLQGSYNFHAVNTAGTTRFSTLQAGIRFRF